MPVKDQTAPRTPSGQKSRATGKPKGGRPPRDGVAASRMMHFRVTPGEEEAIKAAAKAAGLSESGWLRRAVQAELGRIALSRSVDAAIEEAGELRREMGRR